MSTEGDVVREPREGDLLAERYRLRSALGRGGMGDVFDAVDEKLGRAVAVKIPRLGEDVPDTRTLGRFRREALAAARLGHTNIVDITDLRVEEGEPAFLVMERLDGESLAERLQREGTMAREAAVRIALQVLAALDEAHRAQVVHRDVKPENIFLVSLPTGAELVKLLDFGLAYLLEEGETTKLTMTGMTVGTPAFMAPERLRGEAVDPRSDLYSVAVCLHLAVHGRLPDKGESRDSGEADPLLDALIERGLVEDLDIRFEDAATMAAALRLWLETAEARASTPLERPRRDSQHPTRPVPVEPAKPSSRWAVLGAVAFCGLMAVFVVWRVWTPFSASHKTAQLDASAAPVREPSQDSPPASTGADPATPSSAVVEAPSSDLPTSDLPSSDLPTSDLPRSDLPRSDLPSSDLPASPAPQAAPPEPGRAEASSLPTPSRPARPRRRTRTAPEAPPRRSRPRPSLLEAPIEPDWSRARR